MLLEKHYFETVKKHIHDAGVNVTISAGEVSDRLRDAQTRYQKAKDKRRNEEGDQEQDEGEDEEYQRLAEQERQVNSIVGRLEEKMRQVVDSEAKTAGLKDALEKLDKEEARLQTDVLGQRQLRSQRRATRRVDDEDEDAEMDEAEVDREPTPVREIRERNAQNPPRQRLQASLAEGQRKWEELSLTQRYGLLLLWILSVYALIFF
jgi:mRNA (guanine-N7-)-methyltransferase